MATVFLSSSLQAMSRRARSRSLVAITRRWPSAPPASFDIGTASYMTLADGTHPIIDMTPILQPDHPNRSTVVQHIGDALRERGYFYAQNVNVLPGDYIQSIYDYSNKAHSLPIDVKKDYVATGSYSGLDVGQPELDYDAGTVSSVRAWDYSRFKFTLAADSSAAEINFTKNLNHYQHSQSEKKKDVGKYPSKEVLQPDFVEVLDDLYDRQNELGSALMVAFAEMLGLPPRTFADMFVGKDGTGDLGTIRLLNYPGNPEMTEEEVARTNTGISPHTDFEAFTLMHQDAPGLQFIPASGEGWIDAPVRPNEFVVTVGDVLERFTNGVLRATPHRVVKTPHKRMSIIRFNAVNAETVIEPMPQFITEERPDKYGWVTMATHMETTMKNLAAGLGAWDNTTQTSTTATYKYIDGKDHRLASSSSAGN